MFPLCTDVFNVYYSTVKKKLKKNAVSLKLDIKTFILKNSLKVRVCIILHKWLFFFCFSVFLKDSLLA